MENEMRSGFLTVNDLLRVEREFLHDSQWTQAQQTAIIALVSRLLEIDNDRYMYSIGKEAR